MRIGLTGGIGSGKSTVAAMLGEMGAQVIDTDAIARRLTAPGGAAIASIAQIFGREVLASDGSLDRERMRKTVFGDVQAKARLESILHPLITAQALQEADAAAAATVVFDVPLLAESSHWRARAHKVLVVDCEIATQVRRVVSRSGWTDAQAEAVIARQATRRARCAVADAVIFNEALDLPALKSEVQALWDHWRLGGI